MRYRKPRDAPGATNRSAAAIAAIERTISADSTERMRRSRSVISLWVPRFMASGRALQSLPQGAAVSPAGARLVSSGRGSPSHELVRGPAARSLRDRRPPRRRGHGRGLHAPATPGSTALVAVKVLPRELASDPDRRAALRARGEGHLGAQPPARLRALRRRARGGAGRGDRVPRDGAARGRDARRALARGPAAGRRGARAREPSSPGRSPRPTAAASSTATSSPATSCSRARERSCSTSASPAHGEGGPLATAAEDVTATLATEAQPLTHVGTLVGTWPYLAPEQVQGRPADARSDVFALGCRPLRGARGPARVPRRDAGRDHGRDPRRRAAGPAGGGAGRARRRSRPLVRQCLAKDPDGRAGSAPTTWRAACAWSRRGAGRRPLPGPRAALASRVWAARASALGLVAAAGAAAPPAARARPRPSSPCASRWPPPRRGRSCRGRRWGLPFAVSPDGRRIVVQRRARAAQSSLWLWSAEDGQSSPARGARAAASRLLLARRAGDRLLRRETTCGACRSSGGPATTITSAPPSPARGRGARGGTILLRAGPSAPTPGSTRFRPRRASRAGSRCPRPRASAAGLPSLPARRPALPLPERGFGRSVADRRLCVASSTAGSPTASRAASRRPSTRARVMCSACAPGRSSPCPSTPEAAGPRGRR